MKTNNEVPDWDWMTEEEKQEYMDWVKSQPAHRDALVGPRLENDKDSSD